MASRPPSQADTITISSEAEEEGEGTPQPPTPERSRDRSPAVFTPQRESSSDMDPQLKPPRRETVPEEGKWDEEIAVSTPQFSLTLRRPRPATSAPPAETSTMDAVTTLHANDEARDEITSRTRVVEAVKAHAEELAMDSGDGLLAPGSSGEEPAMGYNSRQTQADASADEPCRTGGLAMESDAGMLAPEPDAGVPATTVPTQGHAPGIPEEAPTESLTPPPRLAVYVDQLPANLVGPVEEAIEGGAECTPPTRTKRPGTLNLSGRAGVEVDPPTARKVLTLTPTETTPAEGAGAEGRPVSPPCQPHSPGIAPVEEVSTMKIPTDEAPSPIPRLGPDNLDPMGERRPGNRARTVDELWKVPDVPRNRADLGEVDAPFSWDKYNGARRSIPPRNKSLPQPPPWTPNHTRLTRLTQGRGRLPNGQGAQRRSPPRPRSQGKDCVQRR